MELKHKPFFGRATLWHLLIAFTFIIIVTVSYLPQIARSTRTDLMGRDSIWQHKGLAQDYHAYLSKITLGQHGYLMYRNPNTTENIPPLPYYFYYLFFGWITAPFHLWPPYVYHIAKLVAEIGFVCALYYLARVILKKPLEAGLATVIALTTTTLPQLFYNQTVRFSFMPWWVEHLSATGRLDNRPHYAVSGAFLAFSIAMYFRYRKTHALGFLIGSSISGALSALMVPQAVVPFIFIIGLVTAIQTVSLLYHRARLARITFLWIIFGILTLPTLGTIWMIQQYATTDIVWSFYRDFEPQFWNKDPYFGYHMYVTFLPLIIPSIVTWIYAIRQRSIEFISLMGWTVLPLLMYPFLDALMISKFRLLHSAIQIPLAITATYAIVVILPKYIPKVLLIIFTILYILYSFLMIGVWGATMWNEAARESPWYSHIYQPADYMDTIREVKKRLPPDTHILAGDVLSNIIPSFHPVISYTGYYYLTYKYDEKMWRVNAFYSGLMTLEEAYAFLRENNIMYVFEDMETKAWGPQPRTYPFLTPVWNNATVTLYEVQ